MLETTQLTVAERAAWQGLAGRALGPHGRGWGRAGARLGRGPARLPRDTCGPFL